MKYKKDKTNLLHIRLSDAELEHLDAIAADEKRTRSDVIRLLISSRGVAYGTKEKAAI